MKSLWNDASATRMLEHYQALGIEESMALRVYSSRLLGGNPSLVLHGGGNTSYKTQATDLIGQSHQVLCIKGSGWDLDSIEPAGLPAVKLQPLLDARKLDELSDEDMVALQRLNLLDPQAPNPSIETLLHAFLPHKFVDHTHSTAVLALVDQVDSADRCGDVFGNRMGFVPYVKPGFELARRAAAVFEQNPTVEGLILDKHGIITFGDDARESYDRMIDSVTLVETQIDNASETVFAAGHLPANLATSTEIAPIIRGAVSIVEDDSEIRRQVSEFRQSPEIDAFINGSQLNDYARRGVSTPDLAIRIKNQPLLLPPPSKDDMENYSEQVRREVEDYVAAYQSYFERCNALDDIQRVMLDPMPRLVLVPGVGMFGLGHSIKDAGISADIGEIWIEAVTAAERLGEYSPLSEHELFKMEYWSLEQAKLAGKKFLPLSGQVAVVTGGGGAIGEATASLFAANGAHVVIGDLAGDKASQVAESIGDNAVAQECDVTNDASMQQLFDAAIQAFGGVDILISNAGAAVQGEIATLPDEKLRESFELNFFAHQRVAKRAVDIMRSQQTGGVLLFNASKQAINPGPGFGAYGSAKAATLFLSRQYALECASDGIRSNAVNADRIRSGLLDETMIASRASSRGVSEVEYMSGNLLGQEVRASDVAQAFLHLALASRTTAGVTTVDGGNIAATLR